MSSFDSEALFTAGAAGLDGDASDFQVAADRCLSLGDEASALMALDRAYGLAPHDTTIASMRAALLDRFAIEEHGLVFRYVPAGTFLMGSTAGDPDERPVHPVALEQYWIADVPITWTAFCRLAGWTPPPDGRPPGDEQWPYVHNSNKIRRQYCETKSEQVGWHGHVGADYDRKPMVAVGWAEGEALAHRLSDQRIQYALPSEAEWEKAARGGLIGKRYPWGDDPPARSRCDFDHFGDWQIADPRALPPNGYGLHGMAGSVWEWTSTSYDALAYGASDVDPPEDHPQRVLRGGSWTDAAAAVTVSFRHAAIGAGREGWRDCSNPNVGFRLVRRLRGG